MLRLILSYLYVAFSCVFTAVAIAIIMIPVWIVLFGFLSDCQFLMRIIIITTGFILCRIVKPVSILLNKDLKIF